LAQKCLASVEGKETRIIEALNSGRQDIRAAAANWIIELGCAQAIPALKKRLAKEKSDIAKGALMEALEKLGVPTDEFLDRTVLKSDAAKALRKGMPKNLDWFPFETLPVVHWDNGDVVDAVVVKWLIYIGFKLKSPDPSTAIRKYCEYMDAQDRQKLGRYILEAWLAQDVMPKYTLETATPVAKKEARQLARWYKDMTAEQLFQQCLNRCLNECLGSAIREKGILAIPAACCGHDAVPNVESYLKKWYGHRVHQCKALIRMLAWNDDPLAIQLLLSVANRFRTKGIQDEAAACVQELAVRQGWTVDQLADRTIPAAGFDEHCTMRVDYGSRRFLCRLDDNFKFTIFKEDGKTLKNLPNAAKADDPDLVKAAKKEVAAAKKMLKNILKLQKERLYEALCTQRQWNYGDLNLFLFKHPVVSRYCQKLVWARLEKDKVTHTFRLMEDLTLTDADDNEFFCDDADMISLAHSCNTDSTAASAWLEHFDAYEIEPLFVQFGQEMYELSDKNRETVQIDDFKGYMLDNFKLRSLASKLSYVRGQAEDGGFFYYYCKHYPGLQIKTVIEFSGTPLPEENVRVALISLYFERIHEQKSGYHYAPVDKLELQDVPPVLLSESWNDMRRIAATGSGFHKDWENKTEY